LIVDKWNLKRNSSFSFALSLVGEVDDGPLGAVEDEPPFVPGLEFESQPAFAHLEQVAAASVGVDR
jgi:hypothetical protein